MSVKPEEITLKIEEQQNTGFVIAYKRYIVTPNTPPANPRRRLFTDKDFEEAKEKISIKK